MSYSNQPFKYLMIGKRLAGEGPVFPDAAYPGDAGYDLALSQDVVVAPGGTVNVPTGVAVALPEGTFGWVTGRSSTWAKHGIQVMPGIIDEGWRGELRVLLHRPLVSDSNGPDKIHLPAGTRIAQLIVLPNLRPDILVVEAEGDSPLPPGDRGTNGFGSTGA